MERIESFLEELRSDLDDSEIAAGLTNGNIEKPEWLSVSEDTDHLKIWDDENGGSRFMGFYRIDY